MFLLCVGEQLDLIGAVVLRNNLSVQLGSEALSARVSVPWLD